MKTTHTDALNAILKATAKPKKVKQKPVECKQIEALENMTPLQESLSKCIIAGSNLMLPKEKIDNYPELRKALINAGAQYKKNTFVFPSDAQPIINMLMSGGKVNIKKDFQYFPTPQHLAERMAEMASLDHPDLLVLEPSAGQGAIVKALLKAEPRLCVHAYELMEANRKELEKIKDCIILGNDFINSADITKGMHTSTNKGNLTFDRVVANPPFSKNQDIDHVLEMYRRLNKNGRIVVITSTHWQFSSGKKETNFRNWLDEIGAVIEEIPAETFKESGTNIKTVLITIDK